VLHQVAALLCVLLPTIIRSSENIDYALSTTILDSSPNYPITKTPTNNPFTHATSSYSSHPFFKPSHEIQTSFSQTDNISTDNDPSTDVSNSFSSHAPFESWDNLHKIVENHIRLPITDVYSDSYSNSNPNVLNTSSKSPILLDENSDIATHQDISNILTRFSLDAVQATEFAERMGIANSAELAESLGEVHLQGPEGPDDRPRALPLKRRGISNQYPISKSGGVGKATKRLFLGDQTLCYKGTCEFFLMCWLGGGLIDGGCGGFLFACCNRAGVGGRNRDRPESYRDDSVGLTPRDYGPIRNDPSCGLSSSARLGAQRRIVGGTEAGFGSFPWQAYIRIGSSRCGGSLVNENYVITAGHCVARARPSQIRVTLGDYILNSDQEPLPSRIYGATKIKVHPRFKFTPSADRFDVAVIRLDIPVHYEPHVQPICLPEKGASWLGEYAWAAGWGALKAGSRLRPKTLQTVDVPIIDSRQCEDWHKAKGINVIVYDEMMCAGYLNGDKDSCQGDSGGPLMIQEGGRWYLAGIVSAGYSCAERKQPGIYHKVAYTSDWISWAASGG